MYLLLLTFNYLQENTMLNINECHIDVRVNSSINNVFAFLQNHNRGFFTDERLQSYAQTAAAQNFDLNDLVTLFNCTCSTWIEKEMFEDFIYAAEAIFAPNFDKFELRKAIADTKVSTHRQSIPATQLNLG